MFAVVDVETTGGHASGHGMTEIAIVVYDGMKVVDSYSTLLNPQQSIPLGIQTLTGITPEMVKEAPIFKEKAEEIRDFLGDHIFVAHNVNFDFSFVRSAFSSCGVDYNPKRLCSVRYARKVEKGLRSYSLKNLCAHFEITNEAAHRAWGDAFATAKVLGNLLEKDKDGQWQYLIKKNSGEFNLPANLPSVEYKKLPEAPGVYYFKDQSGKAIYIGKATNLKKRVASHFISDKETKRSQAFKREIYHIEYEETGSELLASLLEDNEIRQYWPKYNSAQKKPKKKFGVYAYQNQKGINMLAVNQVTRQMGFMKEFFTLHEAQTWVMQMVNKYELDAAYCGFPFSEIEHEVSLDQHNERVDTLIKDNMEYAQSFVIKTKGRSQDEDGFALIDDGQLAGIGFIPHSSDIRSHEDLRDYMRELHNSITTQGILNKVLESGRYPIELLR
tara:strand:- start:419 stop:1747 length:1329 start_codon:yes stop_codon:yes gene_type:complete